MWQFNDCSGVVIGNIELVEMVVIMMLMVVVVMMMMVVMMMSVASKTRSASP